MAFKLGVPTGAKPNAIQPTNKNTPQTPQVTEQNKSNESTPAKKPSGLIIPGKTTQPGIRTNPAPAIQEKDQRAQLSVEHPKQELKQELANLPEGVDEKVYADFLSAKDVLHRALIDNKDMIGYALRRVMVDLQSHPELAEFLLPEDLGAMVRSLHTSYGTTLAIKEKKSKGRKKKDSGGGTDIDLSDLQNLMV